MNACVLFSTSMLVSAFAFSASAQESGVTEVVVTAQKRVEKLQDVPISMEVVSGAKLEKANVNTFGDVVKFIPNVFVTESPGNSTIYIRGFGSSPTNYAFDQSVSLYADGVYAGRNKQSMEPFFDLERVEVLRGPQGALFGKNTAAGAVSVISAGPTSDFQASVNTSYSFDLKGPEIDGYVSGPINDQISARLAFKFVDQDGYVKNLFNGEDQPTNHSALGRLTLRYVPSTKFDYTLKVEYADKIGKGNANVSSSLTGPQDPHEYRYTTPDPFGPEGTKLTSWLVSGNGNLKLGDFTATSVTGYSFFRSDIIDDFDQTIPTGGTTNGSVFVSFPENFSQFSQEVRLLSPVGKRFEFIVGAYYDNSSYKLTHLEGFNINAPPVLVYTGAAESHFRQDGQTYSVFGQGTFHVVDRLRLEGSLRYTKTDKQGNYDDFLRSGPFPLVPVNSVANAHISEDNIDPSVTLQYDLAPRVMLYATYGRGSKSGGFASNTYGTTNADFTFKPEKSVNYEAGVKSTLADGKLVVDVSVYDTSFTNLQVSSYNSSTNNFQTSNAASATSKGVEGSVIWYPARDLDLRASAAYQNSTYDNFPGAPCLASQTTAQCDPTNPASVALNNIKGEDLPYTSKFSFSTEGHYRLRLPNETAIDTTIGVHGRSKYFDSDDESPLYGLQKGYAKLDVRLQFGPANERWHVALVGKNLTDERTTGYSFFIPFPITNAPRANLILEETRNISIEAGMKF